MQTQQRIQEQKVKQNVNSVGLLKKMYETFNPLFVTCCVSLASIMPCGLFVMKACLGQWNFLLEIITKSELSAS